MRAQGGKPVTHTFAVILIGVLAVGILAAVWHVAGRESSRDFERGR